MSQFEMLIAHHKQVIATASNAFLRMCLMSPWPLDLRDGQVIAAGQGQDLTGVTEGCTHDDGVVAKLLVVVVDASDRLYTCQI